MKATCKEVLDSQVLRPHEKNTIPNWTNVALKRNKDKFHFISYIKYTDLLYIYVCMKSVEKSLSVEEYDLNNLANHGQIFFCTRNHA